MGRLIEVRGNILVVHINDQPTILKRESFENLLDQSVAEESQNSDSSTYKKSKYYRYLNLSKEESPEARQEFEGYEKELFNKILKKINSSANCLQTSFTLDEIQSSTVTTILNLAEIHNKKIIFGLNSEIESKYFLFKRLSFFERIKKTYQFDSVFQVFSLSEVKKITTEDGINFDFELNSKFEKITNDFEHGYDLSSPKIFNVSFSVSVQKKVPSIWQKKSFIASFLIFLAVYVWYDYRSFNNIDDNDWKSFITTSCSKSISGNVKWLTHGETALWSHTMVSMQSWARARVGDRDYCRNMSDKPSDIIKEMQCFSRYDEKWDWLNRCMPVVEFSLRESLQK
jgi:hypothetical protein